MATLNREKNIPLGTFTNQRKDNWWFMPALQGLVIIVFVIYTSVMLFTFKEYRVFDHFRSPIFDLDIPVSFQKAIGWPVNNFWFPAAILVLWVPIGYRATCYYMRKIYYRSFFGNPPACGVEGVNFRRGKYKGETFLPFILNNYHRYFLYAAIVVALFHWYELLTNGFSILVNGSYVFGISLGTVVLALDTILLTFYVVSCHAFRHLFGGGSDCYSCSGVKSVEYHGWKIISKLNEMHGTWFWLSLISVMVADFYIRLLAGNFGFTIKDIVFFHL